MLLVRLALRNALRSRTRSLLTATTVLLGTALLTVALAWIEGVIGSVVSLAADGVGHARVTTPAYAAREELMPLHEALPDLGGLEASVWAVPGVVEVVPRITTGVILTVGDELGDVFALAIGAPPAFFRDRLDLGTHLVEGRLPTADRGEVLLGATTARQLGAKVGDEVVLLGQTRDGALSPIKGTVTGVAHVGSGLVDQAVYVPLPALQWLADLEGTATELLVFGEDPDAAAILAERVRGATGGLEVQAWSAREPWIQLLPLMEAVEWILQAVIVFVTALGVWNTMLMSVLERTEEIGVLRAMGLTRRGTIVLFVTEALAIASVGGLAGVAVGSGFALYLEVVGLRMGERLAQNIEIPIQETMYADLSPEVASTAFALGLVMALLGAALPSARAARIEPVEAMREG